MTDTKQARSYWFVGATYHDIEDQAERFINQGIWENGYTDKYLGLVRSMQPGDRIAIKSTFTRKCDLPFDNGNQTVSVMSIKAIGTITENLGDGQCVKVNWIPVNPPKEWYFYTYWRTIWRVLPDSWEAKAMIDFTFDDKPQDYNRFRNAPNWREKFGDQPQAEKRFKWTRFYEAIATGLLKHKNDRSQLVQAIHDIGTRVEGLSHLTDHYSDDESGPLRDICPFTTMGIFNRKITDTNRKIIAKELADFLEVDIPVPETFEGLPILNNLRSWFFGFNNVRKPEDIDTLWEIFAAAIALSDLMDNPQITSQFVEAFDKVNKQYSVSWNLTSGLFWIRPWQFISLDSKSREFITKFLKLNIGRGGHDNRCSGVEYLDLIDKVSDQFEDDQYPVHSFPELSLAAWEYEQAEETPTLVDFFDNPDEDEISGVGQSIKPYSIQDILDEGCFLSKEQLQGMLECLRMKKNVILQGPPGTGKTWLARKLAFALMGQRNQGHVRAVQFHPNLSYEDFVRGWRPSGQGQLDLVDGPFLQMIKMANEQPDVKFVLVIEEINRGNPAQVFGEMLTLLEADKRTPSEALELCYSRGEAERVFIPSNLCVIGTMNIADRSLALVDLALRRRFAFIDLEPQIQSTWCNWVSKQFGIEQSFLEDIQRRMIDLNQTIEADSNLGRQFRIGHSYVTPHSKSQIDDPRQWFLQVVHTEIQPLLEEYWFDSTNNARKACDRLAEGL